VNALVSEGHRKVEHQQLQMMTVLNEYPVKQVKAEIA